MGAAAVLAVSLAACPAAFAQSGGPISPREGGPIAGQPAAARAKDTAGAHLREAWGLALRKYSDALFISVSAWTDASGEVHCDPALSPQDGWAYTFVSPKAQETMVVLECRGVLSGPMRQLMAREGAAASEAVEGRFIDSDFALELLAKSGVSLKPEDHKASGRRPFRMTLSKLVREGWLKQPVLWTVEIGKGSFLVDAVRKEPFDARHYADPATLKLASATAKGQDPLLLRPRRKDVFTARLGLDAAARMAKRQDRGASLMAVEGFVDAWGGSSCTGSGDGWAYYFYSPQEKDFIVLYVCAGKVAPGPKGYVPVDFNAHQQLSVPFADSSQVLDSVLRASGSAMNEGMGRNYTRLGTLRLLNFRSSPFASAGRWKTTMVWRLELGRTAYRLDGHTGELIDVVEE